MTLPVLEVRGLGKRFGYRWVVRDLTFQVEEGQALAVCGPNGSGKTTLLRMLAGAARPSAGQVRVEGIPVAEERARRRIGYLGHEPFLVPELTAYENLLWAARVCGADRRAAEELLERLGLARWARVPARALSRGQRQRLALARALVHRPRLLLLDEPWTSLDAHGREALARLLEEHRRCGGALVVASPDPPPGFPVLRL